MNRDVPRADVTPVQGEARAVNATEWTLQLPYDRPLSLNDRQGHFAKAAAIHDVVRSVRWLTKCARIPACERIRVELHWVPKVKRRRDQDNPVAMMKVCVDALVREGVVPDDTEQYVERVWPIIHEPNARLRPDERVYLRVIAL